MRWKNRNYSEWKPWFAWRPVKLETGEWVWWEAVFRRYSCDIWERSRRQDPNSYPDPGPPTLSIYMYTHWQYLGLENVP